MTRTVLLICWVSVILCASCSRIEYQQAPPNDLEPISKLPMHLCGKYIIDLNATIDAIKKLTIDSEESFKEIEFLKLHKGPVFKADSNGITFYESKLKRVKNDSLALEESDWSFEQGFVIEKSTGNQLAEYKKKDGYFHFVRQVDTTYISLNSDSIRVKYWDGHLVAAFALNWDSRCTAIICKTNESGIVSLQSTTNDLDDRSAVLQKICAIEVKDGFADSKIYVANPNKKELTQIINKVYEPLLYFKKVQSDD